MLLTEGREGSSHGETGSVKSVSYTYAHLHFSVLHGATWFQQCTTCHRSEMIRLCLGHNLETSIQAFKERHSVCSLTGN